MDTSESRPLTDDKIREIIKKTGMRMTQERYNIIKKYNLTEDFITLREAHYNFSLPEEGFHFEWAEEFYQFPTSDNSSFVERRLIFLQNPENKTKYPFQYQSIMDSMGTASLMELDDIEGTIVDWGYYNELGYEESRLFRLFNPALVEQERLEEEVRKESENARKKECGDVIEYSEDLPEGVRLFNGIYQAVDPETGIWYKTQPEYGYKHNLFVWIKEQGNSEELTEELESWRANKPKLSHERKRNQIIITNIIKGVCERHIFIISQNIGTVVDIFYPINKVSGKQDKAFVEFKDTKTVNKAIRLLNEMHLGRSVIYASIPNNTDNTKKR